MQTDRCGFLSGAVERERRGARHFQPHGPVDGSLNLGGLGWNGIAAAVADACQEIDILGMLRGLQYSTGIEGGPQAHETTIRGMHDTFIQESRIEH